MLLTWGVPRSVQYTESVLQMADRNYIQSQLSETSMVWYRPCPCSLSLLFSILVIYEENDVPAKPVAGAASVRRSWCTRLC
jgi:hypothetical protein